MADAGNIEVPECSSPTPTTARKFENLGLSDSRSVYLTRKRDV